MSQSRLSSFIEAWVNVAIGFWISFASNMLILPRFGFTPSFTQNLQIGLLFTVISIVRSYVVRRWFNSFIVRAANKMAGDTNA